MQKIIFGTDGFRGIIADNFTFQNVSRIAAGIAGYLHAYKPQSKQTGVIVGFDRRFLSDAFAERIARELAQRGIPVFISNEPVPTPAVSCYIRKHGLPAGVIVTASHNPCLFNGVKIKNEFGASAGQEVTAIVERLTERTEPAGSCGKNAAAVRKVAINEPYLSLLKRYVNVPLLNKTKFNVLIDAMHGVGSGIVERVLCRSRCRITTIRGERDVLFGGVNPEPILHNLAMLRSTVKATSCDLALAFDGDADRIGAMCPDGRFISSHQAICLLLLHCVENRHWSGKVVKSINTTTMVDKITRHYGLPLDIVPVGFKHIAAKMLQEDVLLGGEESGGIGFKKYMPERDGVLAGLLLLELMACRRRGIIEIMRDMEKRFGKFVYLRRDMPVRLTKKIPHPQSICGKKVARIDTYDGTKFTLEDESWLLIRASGTEPIVRIYAEAGSEKAVRALINFGCGVL